MVLVPDKKSLLRYTNPLRQILTGLEPPIGNYLENRTLQLELSSVQYWITCCVVTIHTTCFPFILGYGYYYLNLNLVVDQDILLFTMALFFSVVLVPNSLVLVTFGVINDKADNIAWTKLLHFITNGHYTITNLLTEFEKMTRKHICLL